MIRLQKDIYFSCYPQIAKNLACWRSWFCPSCDNIGGLGYFKWLISCFRVCLSEPLHSDGERRGRSTQWMLLMVVLPFTKMLSLQVSRRGSSSTAFYHLEVSHRLSHQSPRPIQHSKAAHLSREFFFKKLVRDATSWLCRSLPGSYLDEKHLWVEKKMQVPKVHVCILEDFRYLYWVVLWFRESIPASWGSCSPSPSGLAMDKCTFSVYGRGEDEKRIIWGFCYSFFSVLSTGK